MNTAVRSLLLAVYLTGTVLAPVLHLIFHDVDHDHLGGGIRRHAHPEPDAHSHGHPHSHPHEPTPTTPQQATGHGHRHEEQPAEPEHGSGSAAHFDAALSDNVAQTGPLDISELVWMREPPEPLGRYEFLDPREVAVRGPPRDLLT